ncbi:hypothetical protein BDR06DRAFT_1007154 [Suillus hirtellus]|nr:hypothetical protein BDR06DRAFT_1007154 [Suillus hirtellus]
MFQRGFHLRLPSSDTQRSRSRSSSQADQLLRPQSNPGVSRSIGRSTTPDPGSGSSSNYLSAGEHGNTSRSQNHRSTSEGPAVPGLEVQLPSSPMTSLDEPISTGVRRHRDSGASNHGDPTKLTLQ